MQKWLSKESLPIAEKRREAKGKGERERYTQLNEEFQRIGRRDKKAFLSGHCKEIEENYRMGKTRDLFKKIGNIKGTHWSWQTPFPEKQELTLHMDITRWSIPKSDIILFAVEEGEALHSQQKQDQELTMTQIMNSLLPNSDLN